MNNYIEKLFPEMETNTKLADKEERNLVLKMYETSLCNNCT